MSGPTNVRNWIFPTGATLNVGGVFLYAATERYSFYNTQDWIYKALDVTFGPALLIGTVAAIVGALLDARRLYVAQLRTRGVVCWLASAASAVVFVEIGSIHTWTATFIFPAFAGFVAGAIFLTASGAGGLRT